MNELWKIKGYREPHRGALAVLDPVTVRLWDARTARQEHEWEIEAFAKRVAFVRDGRWLIWKGSESGEYGGWDVGTRKPLPAGVGDHWRDVDGVTTQDGGQRLWATTLNQELRVCELPAGVELWRSKDHPFCIDGLAISPSGYVATGCPDGVIRIWELTSGERASEITIAPAGIEVDDETLPVSPAAPTCLAFSPEGLLAAGCADGRVRVWRYGFERSPTRLGEARCLELADQLLQERAQRHRYDKLSSILQQRGPGESASA